ncbi:hypothetical protein QVD17_24785 [Tagetes erecta]|uniref:Rapid ALkalinization Factor n=1 Tax=Tagetes erecta TaxID=13708 RepID=A0AAD8KFR7_TARER|nr:hypothetical protein QVD17_24785 [Tagetes erecta]
MINRGTRTTSILSLLIIMLLVIMMMIKECDGWTKACNGSTTGECQVMVDEEEEFMMDTEEHRRMLAGNGGGYLSNEALDRANPACGHNCGGKYAPASVRPCKAYELCHN